MEYMIIKNCAPVLGGLKTGGLFTCFMDKERIEAEVEALRERLSEKGIFIYILKTTPEFSLIYVCRKEKLIKDMKNSETRAFLKKIGYREFDFEGLINKLKQRLSFCSGFPHEIGLFLGYPLDDVIGFIKNKGRNFRLCGCWKVYGDEKYAEKIFYSFKRCTELYKRAFIFGKHIDELTLTNPCY